MQRFGESEVEDFHLAGGLDHDVGALQIAMDDAALVRARDAGRDLARDVEELRRLERATMEALRQCFPFAVLHDEIRSAIGLADFVDGGNVRMPDGRRCPRLAHETRAALFGHEIFGAEDFERDGALESGVASEVNSTHPASAQNANDLKAIERLRDFRHGPPADSTMRVA